MKLHQTALESLQPKPAGRPPLPVDPHSEKIKGLEDPLQQLRIELKAAQVREEIALVMPHLLIPPEPAQKKTALRKASLKRSRRRHSHDRRLNT